MDEAPRRSLAQEAEDVLRRLRGVTAVRVDARGERTIERVHVLASADRSPRAVVADVIAALAAELGVTLDPAQVRVATARPGGIGTGPPAAPAEVRRPHLLHPPPGGGGEAPAGAGRDALRGLRLGPQHAGAQAGAGGRGDAAGRRDVPAGPGCLPPGRCGARPAGLPPGGGGPRGVARSRGGPPRGLLGGPGRRPRGGGAGGPRGREPSRGVARWLVGSPGASPVGSSASSSWPWAGGPGPPPRPGPRGAGASPSSCTTGSTRASRPTTLSRST